MIDGTGAPPRPNATVLVRDGRITAVGPRDAVAVPADVPVHDVNGHHLLPGLIDIHVHYFEWMGELFLAHGVTTVKDVGNDVEWIATERLVERHRMVKDPGEIAILRRACRSVSDVAREIPALVTAGRTELEIARAIDQALDRAGLDGPAFPTIVAAGPNSALPHARPSDRRLVIGDLVLLDFGGRLDGYCGDLTRMAAVGQVGAQARSLFEAVREAQTAAIAVVRPGQEAPAVDTAAREVLERHGLSEAVLHATGHGLGLELHEAPRIARPDPHHTDRLEAGMVCTIEPGAYVDGFGGVRLEDDVLVTAEGCEVLTDAPRDLVVV